MKNAMKKLLSLMLVVMLLLSVVPFQAFADGEEGQVEAAAETEAAVVPAAQSEEDDNQLTDTDLLEDEDEDEDETPSAGEDVARGLPDGVEIGDKATVFFYVIDDEDNECLLSKTDTKVGSSFPSFPSSSKVLEFYAKNCGTSDGMGLKGWYKDPGGAEAFGSTTGLKVNSDEVYVYAIVDYVEVSVSLDAKGGKLAPGKDKIQVKIGQEYPELPTPTRSGYSFDGWYVTNAGVTEQIEAGETIVRSTARPFAKWVGVDYTVTVMWYEALTDGDESSWVEFDSSKYSNMPIPTGSTLSTSTGTFPTSSEINWKELDSSYTLKGWKFLKTGNEFKPGSTKITVDNAYSDGQIIIVPRLQRTVKLEANHPTTGKNYYVKSFTVEIGSRIGELPTVSPCYEKPNSWSFDLWSTEPFDVEGEAEALTDDQIIATRSNLTKTSEHPVYYPKLGNRFYAWWVASTRVDLHFHLGKTSNDTVVYCYEIPATGTFSLNSLDLYKYCPNYSKYDDGVDTRIGWFTEEEWENYTTGKPSSKINMIRDEDRDEIAELHLLLIDNGTDANKYNNNNATADKTNPKTGDIIMGAVVVLVISAAALAAVYYVSKKKRSAK